MKLASFNDYIVEANFLVKFINRCNVLMNPAGWNSTKMSRCHMIAVNPNIAK